MRWISNFTRTVPVVPRHPYAVNFKFHAYSTWSSEGADMIQDDCAASATTRNETRHTRPHPVGSTGNSAPGQFPNDGFSIICVTSRFNSHYYVNSTISQIICKHVNCSTLTTRTQDTVIESGHQSGCLNQVSSKDIFEPNIGRTFKSGCLNQSSI